MKRRTPVRHKSAGLPIWTAERPEQREGEDHGWSESKRASVDEPVVNWHRDAAWFALRDFCK